MVMPEQLHAFFAYKVYGTSTPNKNNNTKAKNRKLCKNGYHKLFSSHRNDSKTRSDTLREANYITPIDRDKEIKRAISLVIIGALIFFLGLLLGLMEALPLHAIAFPSSFNAITRRHTCPPPTQTLFSDPDL